ncbi:hypothetical protein GCM10010294_02600 [Streptomyces griseoloalbus]|nr:hypothetical protein GCM10010294_02600 [Streptomyces griseoloalbus]
MIGLDLSGADLSGGVFHESWFTDAKLVGARLVGVDLYRSDAEGADFSGADLTRASLVRVNLDDAVFRGAVLDGADLVKVSLYGVDASAASLRGTRLMGASLIDVNFCGSDLSEAVVQENTFKVTVDEKTNVTGMSGTVFGPVHIIGRDGQKEIGGVVRVDGDADLVGGEAFREVQGLGERRDHAPVGGEHGVERLDGQLHTVVLGVGAESGERVRDAFPRTVPPSRRVLVRRVWASVVSPACPDPVTPRSTALLPRRVVRQHVRTVL